LVNNAGAAWLGAVEDTSEEEAGACFALNFQGPLALMRAVAPIFRQKRSGRVINMSAAASIVNYPGFGLYGAAKAALDAASESYAAELAPYGVKVTQVQPGPFRTSFVTKSLHRTTQQSEAYQSTVGTFSAVLGRMDGKQPGDPAKAAAAIWQMVAEDRAPKRLVLGPYANKKAADAANSRLKELADNQAWLPKTEF
jgi:NAD(P)-dependent dehydrogenase (short-subunit alcohol dehydrogenase family)